MTLDEARKLKKGDRITICYPDGLELTGTVVGRLKSDPAVIQVDWVNGQSSLFNILELDSYVIRKE